MDACSIVAVHYIEVCGFHRFVCPSSIHVSWMLYIAVQVAGVNLDSDIIICMSVSDSATALLTKKHHVFVCINFIVRHIR